MLHPAALPIEQLLLECAIKKTRRGGPGGQHRNKVESAIVITHIDSQIIGQASERRSQHENRAVAIDRLRCNLALALRHPVVADQQPSSTWLARRKGTRLLIGEQHPDFPALLAEALDYISANGFATDEAAEQLKISHSQLIKFLQNFPPAIVWVNSERAKIGLGRLR